MTGSSGSGGAAGLVGSVVSGLIGVVALLACIAAFVLIDDDLGVPGLSGGDGVSATAQADGGPGYDGPPLPVDPAQCTRVECPAHETPTMPPGNVPFPPGSQPVQWNDVDICSYRESPELQIRQVRMSLNQVRDFYLQSLPSQGYAWGSFTGKLRANPFRRTGEGPDIVLGWDGPLRTNDTNVWGRLKIETGHGQAGLCGPAPGEVYITVDLP